MIDQPYTPHSGSGTSIAAAVKAKSFAHTQRERVLQAIKAAGVNGKTRDELCADLCLDGSSLRPRVVSLVEAGLVQPSGEIRRTATGRAAEVLISAALVRG